MSRITPVVRSWRLAGGAVIKDRIPDLYSGLRNAPDGDTNYAGLKRMLRGVWNLA
jgi:hypothetical protein